MHTTESIAHPATEALELGAVLHALSDPVRLQIVAKLAHSEGDHTCGSFGLPVTKSTCTHHFKVLREAGVIHQRAQGTTRLNRLRREDPVDVLTSGRELAIGHQRERRTGRQRRE